MTALSDTQPEALRKLRRQWWFYAIILAGIWASTWLFLRTRWDPRYALIWAGVSAAALAYQLWVLWNGLPENRHKDESILFSRLGAGNIASLARGALIGLVFGFLFLPRPSGWLAWAPGLLYTFAVLIDYLDGYLARVTNQVTHLGEILDMHLDGMGVLASTWLIVQYRQVPWWYLSVGLARYLFLVGLWARERLGKPVVELPPSTRRRVLAGLQMGFIFVMLWPVFSPPVTQFAALFFGVPFLVSFAWDWLLVTGDLPLDAGARFPGIKNFFLNWYPVGLRLGIFFLVSNQVIQNPHLLIDYGSGWLIVDLMVGILLAAGFAGRAVSIIGLASLGFQQVTAPLSPLSYWLIFFYISILILGSGKYSLWHPEEWLIHHKAGERTFQEIEQAA